MCNPRSAEGPGVAKIDGRRVLQPPSNRVLTPEAARPPKKAAPPPPRAVASPAAASIQIPPFSSLRSVNENAGAVCCLAGGAPASKHRKKSSRDDSDGPNSSWEKPPSPKLIVQKKKKKATTAAALCGHEKAAAPAGSIAAAHREKATLLQAQRKMRTAHYGRVPGKVAVPPSSPPSGASDDGSGANEDNIRCGFLTSNSDPICVAYHDEEWGVPVHDDKMLFELLVMAGTQAEMDWTTILKRRQDFRDAFAGFEAEIVAGFSEKKMASVSSVYSLDLLRVRTAVNNANRILQVKREMGSLDAYLWSFVDRQPMFGQYSSCRKMPARTSKAEAISKDMLRRGFRLVGPTVVHTFMQAAGLAVDHLLSCPRRQLLLHHHRRPTTP